jgi:predicted DNA-binding WGR domain protein
MLSLFFFFLFSKRGEAICLKNKAPKEERESTLAMATASQQSPPRAPDNPLAVSVDKHCDLSSSGDYHVLVSKKRALSVLLNQTNSANNNNKFYLIQLIESNRKNRWYVFRRWGRVGQDGQTKMDEKISGVKAMEEFQKLYMSKTSNEWGEPFKAVKGKYTPIAMDAQGPEDDTMEDQVDESR